MTEQPRWYSGKYDSVKQHNVLSHYAGKSAPKHNMTGGEYEAYLRYITSMRMEMIFMGKLVITDAQWYDGAIFSLMLKYPGSFADFAKAVSAGNNPEHSFFEIRRRPDHVSAMFGKRFEFSSLKPTMDSDSNDKLFSQFIDGFGEEFTIKKGASMKEYLKQLGESVKEKNSSCLDKFEAFEEKMLRLENIGDSFYHLWENALALPAVFDESQNGMSNRRKLRSLAEKWGEDYSNPEYKEIIMGYRERIITALGMETKFPNRSIIKAGIDGIKSIVAPLESSGKAVKEYEDFMKKFDRVYNLGLATQHYCKNNDAAGESLNLEEPESFVTLAEEMPPTVYQAIGEMPWTDFIGQITRGDMASARQRWLTEYTLFNEQPTAELKRKLEDNFKRLVADVAHEFDHIATELAKTSVLRMDDDIYLPLIGGSNNDDQFEGDDICIFDPGITGEKGRALVVYPKGNSLKNNVMDTLLSYGRKVLDYRPI